MLTKYNLKRFKNIFDKVYDLYNLIHIFFYYSSEWTVKNTLYCVSNLLLLAYKNGGAIVKNFKMPTFQGQAEADEGYICFHNNTGFWTFFFEISVAHGQRYDRRLLIIYLSN